MDMDTDESLPPRPSSSPSKRLGIKNAIQTNFGDDYVFQIASSQEISSMAVSLSSNAIKFYSPATGQYLGECRGHSGTINEVSFSMPMSAHVLCSCSSDGTIRAWDTRSFKQVSLLRAGSNQEMYSFCVGGSSGNLLAAGCNAQGNSCAFLPALAPFFFLGDVGNWVKQMGVYLRIILLKIPQDSILDVVVFA